MAKTDTKQERLDIQEAVSLREELDELNSRIELADRKKTAVKPEIYRKVKADYEAKMNKIINKLMERSDVLRTEYERTKREEEKVRDKKVALQDELEEIKFRFSLGEYSKEEHDELSMERMAALKTLGEQKADLERSLQLLADILSRIDSSVKPEAKPAEPRKAETKAEVDLAPEPPISEVSVPEAEAEAMHTQTLLDDIAKELEAEIEETEPEEPVSEQEVSLPGSEPQGAEPGFTSEPEAESESEGEKELKCPKCDFVNMPDSWYCERCGAELLQESQGGDA